uniref:Uncharacterized protein n=1 Tax=Rhizophora mucronata TaxID=61149 RepID=A0A2P2QRW3_RHIMU
MDITRAFCISLSTRCLIKDTAYSIRTASHGSVIGPLLGRPNSSSDIAKSSLNMRLLRYDIGNMKRFLSAVHTTKRPLSTTGDRPLPIEVVRLCCLLATKSSFSLGQRVFATSLQS